MTLSSNALWRRRNGPSLRHRFDLLRELVLRDMKLRYKRSLLGIGWTILNPLAQLLVLGFVFGRLLPLGIPNYTIFLFIGLLAWTWFQSALTAGTGVIADNRDLIDRPGFPAAVLPVATVTTNLIHYLFSLPVLLVFLLVARIPITSEIVALPLVIAVQFLLTLGLCYLTAAIHVTFRDTQYLVGIALMLGFYLSPVLYDPDNLPPRIQAIYQLNPMAVLLTAYRDILLYGQPPDFLALALVGLVSILLLVAGYRFFMVKSYHFVEEI